MYLEELGASLGVLEGSWSRFWRSLEVLGGTPPNRSWGVLGVDGGIGWHRVGLRRIKASPGRDSDGPMGAPDRLRTRPDRLRTRPDVSLNAMRSSLDRPKGPQSAQGRPKSSNVFPKSVQEMSIRAPVRGNIRKINGF